VARAVPSRDLFSGVERGGDGECLPARTRQGSLDVEAAVERRRWARVAWATLSLGFLTAWTGCAPRSLPAGGLQPGGQPTPVLLSPVPLDPQPQTPFETPEGSGIWGVLFVSPGCREGPIPCAAPSFKVPGEVRATDTEGNVFGPATSTGDRPFILELPPGTYQVVARMTSTKGGCSAIQTVVKQGAYTSVALGCSE
jgi:hypothetical protein